METQIYPNLVLKCWSVETCCIEGLLYLKVERWMCHTYDDTSFCCQLTSFSAPWRLQQEVPPDVVLSCCNTYLKNPYNKHQLVWSAVLLISGWVSFAVLLTSWATAKPKLTSFGDVDSAFSPNSSSEKQRNIIQSCENQHKAKHEAL